MNSVNAEASSTALLACISDSSFADPLMDLPVAVVIREQSIHWFKMRTRQHLPIQ